MRIARLAREVCQTDFVKVEIEHEAKYLLPDNEETIKATKQLAKEGFVVMPYMFPDPIAAKRLEDAGAACVMPLGAMIGSNKGLRARDGRGRGDGIHGHRFRRQYSADGTRVQEGD